MKPKFPQYVDKNINYPSMPTRFFSFDRFLGEGIINPSVPERVCIPGEIKENLRDKFNSNLPIRMQPTAFGIKFKRIPILGRGEE